MGGGGGGGGEGRRERLPLNHLDQESYTNVEKHMLRVLCYVSSVHCYLLLKSMYILVNVPLQRCSISELFYSF